MTLERKPVRPPLKDVSGVFEQALRAAAEERYVLKLFVSGMTPRSLRAIENLRNFCAEHLEGRHQLQIIDLYQHPEYAREAQVVAAPTLIKETPLPLRRFIGDLSHTERLLAGLDLDWKGRS